MNNTKISIIVPVYKAEKSIRHCVDSLLGQSYCNIEVILVDDGSPDRSGAICDEYAAADSRVKVIHQPNGGVSVARQTGMDNATGDYFIHTDPDDWVEPTMIEELVSKAQETGADYVGCDYYANYANGDTRYMPDDISGASSSRDLLEYLLTGRHFYSLWNVMIRRCFCSGISFVNPPLLSSEDTLFKIRLSCRDFKVAYLPKAFYHYRIDNPHSITKNLSDKKLQSFLLFINTAVEEINKYPNIDKQVVDRFKINALKDLIRPGVLQWCMAAIDMFPEVHSQAIDEGRQYNLFRPLSSCLSIALRGYPRLACNIYLVNGWVIKIKERIQGFLTSRRRKS